MARRWVIGLMILGIVVTMGITIVHHKSKQAAADSDVQTESDLKPITASGIPSRAIASVGQAAAVQMPNVAAPAPQPLVASDDTTETKANLNYFYESMLVKNPQVANYYLKLKDRLPKSKEGELISVYIAEAIARENNAEFFGFMLNLQSALNEDPHAIAKTMLDNLATLQSGPLTYQISLNLAQTLSLEPEEKAQILGQAVMMNMQFDSNGQVDPMSSNVLTAFTLMQSAGITSKQALPYIQRGVEVNQHNSEALNAYIIRAHAYYPDVILN